VYAAGSPAGGVSVINGATCNAVNTSGCTQTPVSLGAGTGPSEVTVDQASGRVYATSMFNSDVDVYSDAICNRTVTWGCGQTPLSVPLGGNPGNPVFDQANETLYVPDQADDEVSYLPGWGF
jgi:DNA-binding beta-propeller fold protein YncE